jgi:hypothetical protein
LQPDSEMKQYYVLIPVLLSLFLVLALDQLSNHRSSSNEACTQAVRTRFADSGTYSGVASAYQRGDDTWGRDEMMLEMANEMDLLTPDESSRLRSGDAAVRKKLAEDLRPELTALLPPEGTHVSFAVSKIDFDAAKPPDAAVRHVAYCKFLVVDGADAHEPFSVVIK